MVECIEVLEHVDDKEAVLNEFTRILNINGILTLTTALGPFDRLLGSLSENYYTSVTSGCHRWAVDDTENVRLISKKLKIRKILHTTAPEWLIRVSLMDMFGVQINDAGELLGRKAEDLMKIENLLGKIGFVLFLGVLLRFLTRIDPSKFAKSMLIVAQFGLD